MEKRIIFATGNQNKMKEIHMILADLGMPIYSMKEAGIDIDIVEDGTTFEENAQIKAKAIAKYLPDDIILADDSGLEIDYLNKEREFIRPDMRELILPMISRIRCFWTGLKECRMKSVPQGLSVPLRRHFRMVQ